GWVAVRGVRPLAVPGPSVRPGLGPSRVRASAPLCERCVDGGALLPAPGPAVPRLPRPGAAAPRDGLLPPDPVRAVRRNGGPVGDPRRAARSGGDAVDGARCAATDTDPPGAGDRHPRPEVVMI